MNHDVMTAPRKEEALQELFRVWQIPQETERVTLAECLGRVAAEDVVSVNTIPAMPISAMDGYAVKSSAFETETPEVAAWIQGADFVSADTGDDVPDGFDAVIPVEQLHFNEEGVLTLEPDFRFQPGQCIRPKGCMMMPGDLLARKNSRITPDLRANLAIGGVKELLVRKNPRVAFIPTGSELVPAGSTPGRGENIESNSLNVSDYLSGWGAEPNCYPIIRDDEQKLEQVLEEALSASDIVLINGGSSRGSEDFNARMLEKRATYFSHSVKTVPGRPVGIAIIDGKPVINLPGPVLAAWVVCEWLVYPMICRWFGIPTEKRRRVTAFLTEDLRKGPPVELYARVRLEKRGELYYATPMGRETRHSEMLLDGLGLLVAPLGQFGYAKGQPAEIELLCPEELIPQTGEAPHITLPEQCDQCPNHCPTEKLRCGRGKAHLERLKTGKVFQCEDEAAEMVVRAAQAVEHMAGMRKLHGKDTADLLNGLSEEEKGTLLALLKKQQERWDADHLKRMASAGREHGRGGRPQ